MFPKFVCATAVAMFFVFTLASAQIGFPNACEINSVIPTAQFSKTVSFTAGYARYDSAESMNYTKIAFAGYGLRKGNLPGKPGGIDLCAFDNLEFEPNPNKGGLGMITGYTLLSVNRSGIFDFDTKWFVFKAGLGKQTVSRGGKWTFYGYARIGCASLRVGDSNYAGAGRRAETYQLGIDAGLTAGIAGQIGSLRTVCETFFRTVYNGDPLNTYGASASIEKGKFMEMFFGENCFGKNITLSLGWNYTKLDIIDKSVYCHGIKAGLRFALSPIFVFGADKHKDTFNDNRDDY